MCSIIGCLYNTTGSDVANVLVESMEKMEYRGYDSVGLATINNQEILMKKGVGRVSDVNEKLALDTLKGKIGIGHTRWATHGGVTESNAHPHVCAKDKIAVVHNGIIENHLDLKKQLKTDDVIFKSETDTEVIPNLLSLSLDNENEIKNAIIKTVSKLTGQYSFIAMLKDKSTLIGVKNHEPLILGIGPEGHFLSSDILGFAKHVEEIIYLDDEQFVIVSPAGYSIYDFKGNRINVTPTRLSKTFENVEKGDYKHFTIKEINEQTRTIVKSGIRSLEEFETFFNILKDSKRVYITGSGTSYHSALVAKYLFPKIVGMSVEPIMSSEMKFFEDCFDENSTLIAISQSGESADVLNAVGFAKERNAKILSIVNTTTSSLVKASDASIGLNCGYEVGVAATKSFTSQVTILYRLLEKFDPEQRITSQLNLVVDAISKILSDKKSVIKISHELRNITNLYILGRGVHYPIAKEGALKIKELSYIHAEGVATGELKHGPLALMDESTYVIVINPKDNASTYADNLSNASEIKSRGAKIIGISNEPDQIYDHWIPLPEAPKLFYPIIETVPFQLMAYYLSIEKGNDPDYPRNLAKCVTVK
ncbi:glutamine--fructose-6-phosphate transaminase (isomerizing) [Nitrosopumilus sp.]|uniref:glutamine--fructose-6-phosphate transaminase (isomerizing) n=1 Tax=Nitrosopumilus sp. TaxID=2024843 RepID=UPI00292EDB3C|nr:glutamine--fructose-6-phosphate transaminase (isomerizing) [Nitrosopumilus sp.]